MISVKIGNTEGRISSFTVSGHSGYAESGADIVCAGVSALTLAAALGLRDVLHKKGSYESKDGFLAVEITETDDRTEAVLRSMLCGLYEMQKQYLDYIQVKEYRR